MKYLLFTLGCAALVGCSSTPKAKPATQLTGAELGSLIAQYEQENAKKLAQEPPADTSQNAN